MMEALLNSKPKIVKEKKVQKHTIFLNEHVSFSIKDAGKPIGVFGQTNSGKTFSGLIISNQTNCIYFDPQGYLKRKLRQLGEVKNWKFYRITDQNTKDAFKINASVLHPRVGNILAKTNRPSDRTAMLVLRKFANLKKDKNYRTLKKMMEKKRLYTYWEEIKDVLHEKDNGLDLEQIQKGGRYAVDITEITPQSMTIGIVTETISGWRSAHKWKPVPLIIAIDEAQDSLAKDTMLGHAFSLLSGKARQYKITPMAIGVSASPLYKKIKTTFKILVLHKVVYDRKDYESYGISIDEEKISEMPSRSGYCYYYHPDKGIIDGVLLRPNTYYQSLQGKGVERTVYQNENFKHLSN